MKGKEKKGKERKGKERKDEKTKSARPSRLAKREETASRLFLFLFHPLSAHRAASRPRVTTRNNRDSLSLSLSFSLFLSRLM